MQSNYITLYNEQNQFLIEQEQDKLKEAKDDTAYKIQELYMDISELKAKADKRDTARTEYIKRQIKDKEREIYILTLTLSHTIATHEALIKGIKELHIPTYLDIY